MYVTEPLSLGSRKCSVRLLPQVLSKQAQYYKETKDLLGFPQSISGPPFLS
jgi:hypothetical protein